MNQIQYLLIHDSDSSYGNPFMINEWHKQRGFEWKHHQSGTCIYAGYHYLILNGNLYSSMDKNSEFDGEIIPLRPEYAVGAHCVANGRNADSLGICLVGPPFTKAQMVSLVSLCGRLQKKYGVPVDRIVGHKEQDSQKRDPRFDMQALRFYLSQ